MTYAAERQSIEGLFQTGWGSTTPVAWDNVEYTPVSGTAWVDFRILNGSESAIVISGDQYRNVGLVNINIFTPEGVGSSSARTLADTAAGIFRGVTVDDITFRAPSIRTLGVMNGWYQTNLSIPFFRDTLML